MPNTTVTIKYSDGETDEFTVIDEVDSEILQGGLFEITAGHPSKSNIFQLSILKETASNSSPVTMQRTGEKIKFLDVHIGNPFYAHDRVWIRTDYEAASELGDSGERKSAFNFTIDECDEFVERIKIVKG